MQIKATINKKKKQTIRLAKKLVKRLNKATPVQKLVLGSLGLVLVAGVLHSIYESENPLNSLWWAVTTGFTVGYGAVKPSSEAAQVVGSILTTFSIFVFVPLVTALMTVHMLKPKKKTKKKATRKRKK